AEHYGSPIVAASTSAAAPAPARSNAVPNINDLPPNVRATLPRLSVGGAIYSETPSARMVILNGQVFHEGDKPATDTVLEQIRLKSAVLNFRGQRYEVSF
nr:general secretion pathway protein GspB [Pseudomonadota bacterium]